jgi:hypothetical protein
MHIIYLLLKTSKSVLQAEIEVYDNVRHHTFSEIYICRKFYIGLAQEMFVILYILECHIIYLMLKTSKSVLQAEIEVYDNVRHHTFSEIYICRKFYI